MSGVPGEREPAQQETTCTGLTAMWCPIHGDCTCPNRVEAMDSYDCPLHGSESDHPRPVGAAALEARRAAIAAELEQLVTDAEHWNRTHPDEEPIVIDVDLGPDVSEALARILPEVQP